LFAQWISTEGKDYMVSLGKAATFTAEPDETGQPRRTYLDAGESAPSGAVVTYVLEDEESSVALEFYDAEGELVRRFEPMVDGRDEMTDEEKAHHSGPWITTKTGVNRFVWDLRYPGATKILGNKMAGDANRGPLVVPGTYEARLTISDTEGETTLSQTFDVLNDPRSPASGEELGEQLEALIRIRDQISKTHEGIIKLRAVAKQLDLWTERADLAEDARTTANELKEKLAAIEDTLIKPGQHKDTFGLNEPARLHERLASVISVIASADARPTKNSLQVAAKYTTQIEEQLTKLEQVLDTDLARFNALMPDSDLPAVQA
jgi:hypothetical protein